MAKAYLRRFDTSFDFHCDKENCGSNCLFAYELCPNVDCGVRFSRKWAGQHDSVCPQKMVECERSCGRSVMRRLMKNHLADECILRPVLCTFSAFGCESRQRKLQPYIIITITIHYYYCCVVILLVFIYYYFYYDCYYY